MHTKLCFKDLTKKSSKNKDKMYFKLKPIILTQKCESKIEF